MLGAEHPADVPPHPAVWLILTHCTPFCKHFCPGQELEASLDRIFFMISALSGALAVALGAFAAHGLRDRLTPQSLATFETGVRYLMYHALALIGVAWAVTHWPDSNLPTIGGWLMVAGMVFFSGSLALLAFTGVSWLGAIAPIGGLAFILGWLCLALAAWRG
jgi:uncharacterized membrane protein YgdD (TMEM256/DUF423 family)